MVKVAIIIANWKQPKLTIETLDSILKIHHTGFIYKIFLVDNGSPDNSVSLLSDYCKNHKNIIFIRSSHNLGYVGANNLAIKKALKLKYKYHLCANNDIIVKPDFLEKLVDEMENNHQLAIVGPKIYFAPHHEYHRDRYSAREIGKVIWSAGGTMDWNNIYGSNIGIDEVDTGQFDKQTKTLDFISGCCLLIRSDVIKILGSFDSRYFMYLEDVELCLRYTRYGYQIKYIPESVIWHINSGSSAPSSPLHHYFITRNRLLFGFQYARFKTKFALLRQAVKNLLTSHNAWEKKAIIDFFKQKWGKGSWI